MKKIIRFYEDDLRNFIAEKYNVPLEQVTAIINEEMTGYGMGEHLETVFYIEVEEDGG